MPSNIAKKYGSTELDKYKVKAGALIAAEIDRLERVAAKKGAA